MLPPDRNNKLTEEEVAMFKRVGLGHLLTRPGALDTDINWEEELSLGEKQRLAMVSKGIVYFLN